jgi:acyl-coenzyme A thioesterase PaaI-like protein
MADIATYALTLAQRQEECVTANLSMNFLRPALALPLIGEAVSLRAGRNLLIHDVRIWSEAEGPERLIAQATASWVALPNGNRL